MYYIWRLLFSRSYCRPCRVINWAQTILVTNKNKRRSNGQLNSVCIIHMRLGIWWLKRIENLLSLQLEPPTFFLPSFFSRKKKKTERTTFLCCVWRKRLSAKFFSSSPGTKKYMTEGGKTSIFVVYFYILVWNGEITFDFIALEENKR